MRAILISIKPKWVAKILNGEKTIELRKTMPKCKLPVEVYIYCTKEQDIAKITKIAPYDKYVCEKDFDCMKDFKCMNSGYSAKGKIVAKFTLNKVGKIIKRYIPNDSYIYSSSCCILSVDSCLSHQEIDNYLKAKIGERKGYAWHIDNLVILDKPIKLEQKAPQSWCYVEMEERKNEKEQDYL